MRTIEMELCGTVKVIKCPWKKEKHEPVPKCIDCNYSSKICYGEGIVKCKYPELEEER